VSKAPDVVVNLPSRSHKPIQLRFNPDWVTRPVFGTVLAAVTLSAILAGTYSFTAFAAVTGIAALREWHRIVETGGFAREFWISSATLFVALAAIASRLDLVVSWLLMFAGTVVVLLSAAMRNARAVWHAFGLIYIGIPALLLVYLRASVPHAAWVLIWFFLVIWATDTGALIVGNLVGGPKLTPTLSPNKTWSGAIGGVLAASIAASLSVAFFRGDVRLAIIVAAALSIVAHAGDLFESWVKRRFHIKDSGGLIPGHGGVLDRLDSTLAASTAMAAVVCFSGIAPTFGAHL